MKADNPFDRMLELPSVQRRTSVANSAPEICDMLDLAWAAAQAVFEKRAAPEHALTLLPVFLARADAERQRIRDEGSARMDAEGIPPAGAKRSRKKD